MFVRKSVKYNYFLVFVPFVLPYFVLLLFYMFGFGWFIVILCSYDINLFQFHKQK